MAPTSKREQYYLKAASELAKLRREVRYVNQTETGYNITRRPGKDTICECQPDGSIKVIKEGT